MLARLVSDDKRVSLVNEKSVREKTLNTVKTGRKRGRIRNGAERGVQNEIAAVSDERRAVRARAPLKRGAAETRPVKHAAQTLRGRGKITRRNLKRQRKAAETGDKFALVHRENDTRRTARRLLLAQMTAAAALDRAKLGINFVGAVHSQVKGREALQRKQRDADALRQRRARRRSRRARHLKSRGDTRAERLYEQRRR